MARPLPQFGDSINREHPQMQGLIGWWSALECGGGRLWDISEHAQHGTLTNVAAATAWDSSGFLTLDATNDCVDFGADLWSSGHPTAGRNITICGWLRKSATPSGTKTLLQKWENPYSFWFAVTSAGYPIWYIYDGATRGPATGTVSCCTGNWNFVHATYDGSTMRTGTNVSGFGTAAYSGSIAATSSAVSLNSRTSDTSYVLGADYRDWRIYSRSLSDSELTHIYRNPWAAFAKSAGTLAHVPLTATSYPAAQMPLLSF